MKPIYNPTALQVSKGAQTDTQPLPKIPKLQAIAVKKNPIIYRSATQSEIKLNPTRETEFMADVLDLSSLKKNVPKNILPILSKINNQIVKQL
jgi:hypothetical protein